jgi:hypothetical protein
VPVHADFKVEDANAGQTIEVVPAPKDPYDDWYRLQAEIDLHLVKAMNIATELGALITYDKLSVIHRELLAFAAEKKGMSNG